MPRGFTLPELMLSLAVAGLLLGIATPQLSGAMDRINVETVTSQIVGAHQRARMMAIARSQVLTLDIGPTQLSIAPQGSDRSLWTAAGPADVGVTLAGPTRRVTFSPTGVSLGLSNASLVLSRGASVRTVVFSRLGRVRVLR